MNRLHGITEIIREALRRVVSPVRERPEAPRTPSRRAQQAEVLALARLGRRPAP